MTSTNMTVNEAEEKKEQKDIAYSDLELQFQPQIKNIQSKIAIPEEYSALVIFLHGLGDNGKSWQQRFSRLSNSVGNIKWIFPTAAMAPITFQCMRIFI